MDHSIHSKLRLAISFFIIALSPPKEIFAQYYRLYPTWTRFYDNLCIVDVNDDGTDEFLFRSGTQIDIQSWNLRYYYHSFELAIEELYSVAPIPTASVDSIYYIVQYKKGNTLYCKILPPMLETIGKSISPEKLIDLYSIDKNPETDPNDFNPSLTYFTSYIDARGRKIALFRIHTAWDKHGERGILAADIKIPKIVWKFSFGSLPTGIIHHDIDNDGLEEILFGTYANNNGLKIQGVGDDSCHIFVLNNDGSLKWKQGIGPYWTGAMVSLADLNGNGKKQMVVYEYSNREIPDYSGRIRLLNPMNGDVLFEKNIMNGFPPVLDDVGYICIDINQDTKDEIVIGGVDGYVRILDGSLAVLDESDDFGLPISIVAVEDMDGNGKYEIITYIPDEKYVIMSSEMKILCEYPVQGSFRSTASPVREALKTHLLIRSQNKDRLFVQLLKFQKSLIPFPSTTPSRNPYLWSVPFFFFVLLLIILFVSNLPQLYLTLVNQTHLKDNFLIIGKDQKVKFFGKVWENILQLNYKAGRNKNIMTILQKQRLEPLRKVIGKLMEDEFSERMLFLPSERKTNIFIPYRIRMRFLKFFRIYSIFIDNVIHELTARQITDWAIFNDVLAHDIIKPFENVKIQTQYLQRILGKEFHLRNPKIDKIFYDIESETVKLFKKYDGLMKIADLNETELQSIEINKLIHSIIPECTLRLSKKVVIDLQLDDNIPHAMLMEEKFKIAFRNIFQNAVESLKDEGVIRISTTYIREKTKKEIDTVISDLIQIEIHDNGCGIPKKHLNEIFNPFFTLKENGTGMGLTIVKKIIDSHDGKLKIVSTSEKGTSVRMFFKADMSSKNELV